MLLPRSRQRLTRPPPQRPILPSRRKAQPPSSAVYAVVVDALSPDFPLGVEAEVFIRPVQGQTDPPGVAPASTAFSPR